MRRTNMTGVVAALMLLAATTACAGGGDGGAATSGVRGVAVVDAGCPVLEDRSACPHMPLRARIVAVRAGAAQPAASVESGADGAFQMSLPPGDYHLRGENLTGAPLPTAMPVPVRVSAGEFARVTIVFDSGVRGPAT